MLTKTKKQAQEALTIFEYRIVMQSAQCDEEGVNATTPNLPTRQDASEPDTSLEEVSRQHSSAVALRRVLYLNQIRR